MMPARGGGVTVVAGVLMGARFDDGARLDLTLVRANSRVYFTPEEAATYYVAAGAFGVHIGTYTLSVDEVDGI